MQRADPRVLAPLQSAHLSPWPDHRPPLVGFVSAYRSSRAHDSHREWTAPTLRPTGPAKVGCRDTPPPTSPPSVHSPVIDIAADPGSVPRQPASESRSALVVSHHLGGFLRSKGRGLVASRCQSWGSPRFLPSGSRSDRAHVPKDRALPAGVPMHSPRRLFTPLEEFHPTAAAPRHRGRCPLAVRRRPSRPLVPAPLPEMTLGAPRIGASASRLCSAVESVTPLQPLPAGGRPILPGLCSPSRSVLEVRGHPRPLTLALCASRKSEENRVAKELRSASAGLAPRRPHRLAPCGEHRWGWLHQGRPKTPPVSHLAPDTDEVPRDLTGREASDGRSRLTPRVETRIARRRDGTGIDADGIPPSVHREPGRARALPGLTEARIRGAERERSPRSSQCRFGVCPEPKFAMLVPASRPVARLRRAGRHRRPSWGL